VASAAAPAEIGFLFDNVGKLALTDALHVFVDEYAAGQGSDGHLGSLGQAGQAKQGDKGSLTHDRYAFAD
jgi:hypothetical protein